MQVPVSFCALVLGSLSLLQAFLPSTAKFSKLGGVCVRVWKRLQDHLTCVHCGPLRQWTRPSCEWWMGRHGDTLRNRSPQLPCWAPTQRPHPTPLTPLRRTLPCSLCPFPSSLLYKQQGIPASEPSSLLGSWHGASFHAKTKVMTDGWMDFQWGLYPN